MASSSRWQDQYVAVTDGYGKPAAQRLPQTIAVVSPPLDDAGNSIRAQRAIADISTALHGNPYAVQQPRPMATSGR
jgi:hypothetical protein